MFHSEVIVNGYYAVIRSWIIDCEDPNGSPLCLGIFNTKEKAQNYLKEHLEKCLDIYSNSLGIDIEDKEKVLRQELEAENDETGDYLISTKDTFELWNSGDYVANHIQITIQGCPLNIGY